MTDRFLFLCCQYENTSSIFEQENIQKLDYFCYFYAFFKNYTKVTFFVKVVTASKKVGNLWSTAVVPNLLCYIPPFAHCGTFRSSTMEPSFVPCSSS